MAAKNILKNNKGIALFEMLPLLVVFVTLVGLTVGLWGAIHSGVLQSIAARHYAFEVINNRSHYEYHRDYSLETLSSSPLMYNNAKFAKKNHFYGNAQAFLFLVTADADVPEKEPYVTQRGINFFEEITRSYDDNPKGIIPFRSDTLSASFHNTESRTGEINEYSGVNPLWLMQGYGMCLDCLCGDGDRRGCN